MVQLRSLRAWLSAGKTLREYLVDCYRYVRVTAFTDCGAGACMSVSQSRADARATLLYHRLEKSLTLPSLKRPFGLSTIAELRNLLDSDAEIVSEGIESLSRGAIEAAETWNLHAQVSDLVAPTDDLSGSPISYANFLSFAEARSSIRNFSSVPLDATDVYAACEVARWAPSVCNRQASRVHCFLGRKEIDSVLELQNGNRGFGDSVPGLFAVTVKREVFFGANERNQRWIDGGIFAAYLVLGLQAQGLQSCMLNWSQTNARSDELRARADIPDNEDVVVLIAFGHGATGCRRARSNRLSVSDLVEIHEGRS